MSNTVLKSWFDEIFSRWERISRFSTLCSAVWKLRKFTLTLFWQNFRESNGFTGFTNQIVDLTKFFLVRVNFSFFHSTALRANVWHLISHIFGVKNWPKMAQFLQFHVTNWKLWTVFIIKNKCECIFNPLSRTFKNHIRGIKSLLRWFWQGAHIFRNYAKHHLISTSTNAP